MKLKLLKRNEENVPETMFWIHIYKDCIFNMFFHLSTKNIS